LPTARQRGTPAAAAAGRAILRTVALDRVCRWTSAVRRRHRPRRRGARRRPAVCSPEPPHAERATIH